MCAIERMGTCARRVWEAAVEEHRRATPPRPGVTTGHLLLEVLREKTCAGGLILGKLGLDLELAHRTTAFVLQYGRPQAGSAEETVECGGVPHSVPASAVLDLAVEEANRFSPTYPIGTEHLLLGLLRVPEGMGCRVLQYFGLNVYRVRAARDELWQVLRGPE